MTIVKAMKGITQMNKTVIEMAQEAGFDPHDMSDDFACNLINIKRFAELVRADEHEMFLKALNNAIFWRNRYVELCEIIEMFCLDAEAKLKEGT